VPSKYQLLVEEWRNCTRCELHQHRKRVVMARGSLPADVVFVGEAPGLSEDVIGQPFTGPAGKLLDHIVSRSVPKSMRVCFTNLVACVPKYGDATSKAGEPDQDSIDQCAPRLTDLLQLCDPKLIVTVGSLARDNLDPKYASKHDIPDVPQVHILHPAAILRQSTVVQGMSVQKCVVDIRNAIEDMEDMT
jgi:uracil-DNA glycosylase family 4